MVLPLHQPALLTGGKHWLDFNLHTFYCAMEPKWRSLRVGRIHRTYSTHFHTQSSVSAEWKYTNSDTTQVLDGSTCNQQHFVFNSLITSCTEFALLLLENTQRLKTEQTVSAVNSKCHGL